MTEQGPDRQEAGSGAVICPSCGTATAAGDRYCAECGAVLPAQPVAGERWPLPTSPSSAAPSPHVTANASAVPKEADPQETSLWLFGARPTTVIGGGVLLLLLAAALLFAGQRESTGTIVMLSICLAPLALLTVAIGIARAIGARVGGGDG